MKEGELFKAGMLKEESLGIHYPTNSIFMEEAYKSLEKAVDNKKPSLFKRILKMIGYEN
tara:strand:- start:36 stop:212 length:177 start_codon:yes stop_codon:yes gene_type:complete